MKMLLALVCAGITGALIAKPKGELTFQPPPPATWVDALFWFALPIALGLAAVTYQSLTYE